MLIIIFKTNTNLSYFLLVATFLKSKMSWLLESSPVVPQYHQKIGIGFKKLPMEAMAFSGLHLRGRIPKENKLIHDCQRSFWLSEEHNPPYDHITYPCGIPYSVSHENV